MNLLLFNSSLEWGSRGDRWSHSRKEACISFIECWIGIIPPAPIGAKFSRSYLFGGFLVIGDDIVLLRTLYRGFDKPVDWEVLTSLGTEVLVVVEGLASVLLRKNEWDLVERAWGLLLLEGMIPTRSNIQRQKGMLIRQWSARQITMNDVWPRCYQSKAKTKQMSACLQTK